jgi:hypothetical protein
MRAIVLVMVAALLACKQGSAPAESEAAAEDPPSRELVPASVGRPCKLVNQREKGTDIGVFPSLEDAVEGVTYRRRTSEAKAIRVPDGTRCRILATEQRTAEFVTREYRKVETGDSNAPIAIGWVQRDWALEVGE